MYTVRELFDLTHTQAAKYLGKFEYPWEALQGLKGFVRELGKTLDQAEYQEIEPEIWVHRSAVIAATARLMPPCIIGAGTEVRQGAFIRGSVLVGENCVVGNSAELKNAILFDGVQTPHYNYVGDSILGYKAHMGAGAVTSNVKADKTPVAVRCGTERVETGLKKFGAMLGDYAEIGCNAVLNPGTVIGRNSNVYPLSCVRGTLAAGHIYKNNGEVVKKY